ncbi:MAG TPA: ABC transporter permease [bacterium]|nr:ABC transporter permease [bacterium]HNT66049.1 ABC transporter permease [bacterium]HOX85518.1 ABC transporter permease [bacterium]HPG44677.1 ABC transporter permease [bacterium]HPM99416.1 ABC transporter permease [bacterium]
MNKNFFNEKLRVVGQQFSQFMINLHDMFELFGRSFALLFNRPAYFRDTLAQMHSIGVRSLPIVVLVCTFTGMVLALQAGYAMAIYGAKMYVGSLVSISLLRELGPVLTAVVVAGRVGAGIAAEIGSMQVTEQIDAMRALGTNPVKKLSSTRLVAILIMLPILTFIGNGVGILGALLIAVGNLNIAGSFFWTTVFNAITFEDLLNSLLKPIAFAMIISTIGCFMGFHASGGTKGVGEATTRSVVVSIVLIFLVDFLITNFILTIS